MSITENRGSRYVFDVLLFWSLTIKPEFDLKKRVKLPHAPYLLRCLSDRILDVVELRLLFYLTWALDLV